VSAPSAHCGKYCSRVCRLTLAISAQLLPASRICFNRSSSAGVHGVFVLLFFEGGWPGVELGSSLIVGVGGATTGGGMCVADWGGAGAGTGV
jgi:hypothetical protein